MIKIFLTILAIYLLYYAGNIVYDLFLKKNGLTKQSESEEYALTAFAEENTDEIQGVSIDDVERLNTPNSFNRKELLPNTGEKTDEIYDLDHFRNKFESEQDIDSFENISETEEYSKESKEISQSYPGDDESIEDDENKDSLSVVAESERKVRSIPEQESTSLKLRKQFNQFLSLAETQVQVLSDLDGFKVYHSMI